MPAAPAAPPPATPVVPTATVTPPVSKAPITDSTPPKPGGPLSDAFSDLDRYGTEPSAAPSEIPKGPHDQHRDDVKKAEEAAKTPPKEDADEETPPAKPDEPPKDEKPKDETPKETPPAKPKKPADFLREKLAKTEQERDTFKAELEKAKTTKPAEDPEKKTLAERLEAQTKELNTLRDELKFIDYSKHPEFKEQFEKPFVEAYQAGIIKAKSFKVTDADGNTRQAEQADFDKLLQLNDEDAVEAARELFGDTKSSLVLWHREQILQKAASQQKALEEYRKTGSEREKARSEAQAASLKADNELWEKLTTEAIEKHPEFFKPVDGDSKGNELLTKGFERMKAAFNGGRITDKDGNVRTLSRQELVSLHNEMMNKAAAFSSVVHRKNSKITALETELAEIKKELEQFKESEPGNADGEGKPLSRQPAKSPETMEGVLQGLDKVAKSGYF